MEVHGLLSLFERKKKVKLFGSVSHVLKIWESSIENSSLGLTFGSKNWTYFGNMLDLLLFLYTRVSVDSCKTEDIWGPRTII